MPVTISDIAKRAGVSTATVSRVINGQHQFMSQATRERVEALIAELGYVPNSLAQGLKGQRTHTLGILISNMAHPFWAEVLDGIEQTCREHGYSVLFCNSRDDSELESQYITMLQTKQVDGIIINPTGTGIDKFFSLIQNRFPIVTLDRKLEPLGIPFVGIDNISGAELAVDHLISLGHKRIGVVIYQPNGVSVRRERLQGYRESLSRAGIGYDSNYVIEVDPELENARSATRRLFELPQPPSAIFSTNLRINIGVLAALKDLGIEVPRDVSLVAYDDTEWLPLLDPPLTTIATPARRMGIEAAITMTKLIQGTLTQDNNVGIQLNPMLIERASTRALTRSD